MKRMQATKCSGDKAEVKGTLKAEGLPGLHP